MNFKRFTLLIGVSFIMLGCSTSKYYWGHYENGLYKYYKEPAMIKTYTIQLAKVIAKGEPKNRVPPGLHAEYGYILMIQGQKNEARIQFEKEKATWPESTRLMNILINNLNISSENIQSHKGIVQ